jgi:thioredoxin-like negative regulator of GroEL
VDQQEHTPEQGQQAQAAPPGRSARVAIVLVIVAVFAGVLVAKSLTPEAEPAGSPGAVPDSVTSVRNDAMADYEAALQTGKPVYVMFHSLTCQPCVEISAVADEVMPGYAEEVVFVNAITDDSSARELASRFAFQYIPTSFFLAPDGTVVDTHTGTLSEAEMQAFLDRLVTQ